nr:Chain c, ALA-ALA-GLY-ALA-ALA-ALA-ALA-ALA-ALA-ALA [Dianlovirus menglaense]
AAGAAAAAAA